MENQNQPLDRRAQQIADLQSLVDFLAAHPDLPIGNDAIGRVCVLADDDTAGRAELQTLADILDTEVRLSRGGGSYEVERRFGTDVVYRAFYSTREAMRKHGEELKVIAEHRKSTKAVDTKPCAECGKPVSTGGIDKDEYYCSTACAEGEAVES